MTTFYKTVSTFSAYLNMTSDVIYLGYYVVNFVTLVIIITCKWGICNDVIMQRNTLLMQRSLIQNNSYITGATFRVKGSDSSECVSIFMSYV